MKVVYLSVNHIKSRNEQTSWPKHLTVVVYVQRPHIDCRPPPHLPCPSALLSAKQPNHVLGVLVNKKVRACRLWTINTLSVPGSSDYHPHSPIQSCHSCLLLKALHSSMKSTVKPSVHSPWLNLDILYQNSTSWSSFCPLLGAGLMCVSRKSAYLHALVRLIYGKKVAGLWHRWQPYKRLSERFLAAFFLSASPSAFFWTLSSSGALLVQDEVAFVVTRSVSLVGDVDLDQEPASSCTA